MRTPLLFLALLSFSFTFCQQNKYWVRFKDKNHNTYTLQQPLQFLSQKSVERRVNQHIPLTETDLPVSPGYIDSISPYIGYLDHRLKWFNTIVVDMNHAVRIHRDTLQKRITTLVNDSLSQTVTDTFIRYYQIAANGPVITYDTFTYTAHHTVAISPWQASSVYVRDTLIFSDSILSNGFDSLATLTFIDSFAPIRNNPVRSGFQQKKLEEVPPVNQLITYPNRYGAAYHQINMLNADLLHQMGYDGNNVTIAVMDNGFYKADQLAAFDSVRPRILSTWDFVNHENNVYNDGSHGENTFSCMAANTPNQFIGTAPNANYFLYVTEDDNAEWIMEEYNWAAAAEVADSAGAQVFSTSLGYTTFDGGVGDHTYSDLTGNATLITRASNIAYSKGILVVNSAGNEGTHSWKYIAAPADGDSVLAIGAVDSAKIIASFSSRGPNSAGHIKPDLCTQGAGAYVVSTGGGVYATNGTSFSCPIFAGCAASLWSAFPNKTAREIKNAILISADRYITPDSAYGYGVPNFYNAYLFLKTNYNNGILRVADNPVVFPNPFTNELNISFFNSGNEVTQHLVELFNVLGQKVFTTQLAIRPNTFEIVKVDNAAMLQKGEYILRIDGMRANNTSLIKLK